MPQFGSEPGTGPVDHCNGGRRGPGRCRHVGNCLTAYGRALLEAFRDANPGVEFTESANPCLSVIGPRRVYRHYPCGNRYVGRLIDHEGAVRMAGGQAVFVPQPYYTAKYGGFDGEVEVEKLAMALGSMECVRKRLSGMALVVKYAGAGRSWYFPGNSALWVVGAPEAVESLTFEYEVPPVPSALTWRGGEDFKVVREDFDAPCPLPTWQVQLPDWTCGYVSNRGNVCGKMSVEKPWPPYWGFGDEGWLDEPPPELAGELCRSHYGRVLSRWYIDMQAQLRQ